MALPFLPLSTSTASPGAPDFEDLLFRIGSGDDGLRENALYELYNYMFDLGSGSPAATRQGAVSMDHTRDKEELIRLGAIPILINNAPSHFVTLSGQSTLELTNLLLALLREGNTEATNPLRIHQALKAGLLNAFKKIEAWDLQVRNHIDAEEDDGDLEDLAQAEENIQLFRFRLGEDYKWFNLYEALDERHCLYILDQIRQSSWDNYASLLEAVGGNGDLYGMLHKFSEINNNFRSSPADERKKCVRMITQRNYMEVLKDLLRSMDMLAAAATADFNPSYEAALLLLFLIQTEVGHLLDQFPKDGSWGDWYRWAMTRWRRWRAASEPQGADGFTDSERETVSQLTKYQEMCSALVGYYVETHDPPLDANWASAIVRAAGHIIEQINNPYKPGSQTPDSLMFRAEKRAMEEDLGDLVQGGGGKRARTEAALRAAVVALFGPAHVEPVWTGSSRAPGLQHFVEA